MSVSTGGSFSNSVDVSKSTFQYSDVLHYSGLGLSEESHRLLPPSNVAHLSVPGNIHRAISADALDVFAVAAMLILILVLAACYFLPGLF